MTTTAEKLIDMIKHCHPKEKEVSRCELELFKLSTVKEFRNPTKENAPAYEAFFRYIQELQKNHPDDERLDRYLHNRFGESLSKMAAIVRDEQKRNLEKEVKIPEKMSYIKPEVVAYQ